MEWLLSFHSFSFGHYYDPNKMGFGALRVINDDFIKADSGFGTHPHKNMEIVTIPFKGQLQHRDSVGNESVISHGEVQIMSAGTGIFHSEFNASQTEAVELFQIWVLPRENERPPRYEQKRIEFKKNGETLLVSPDGREGSVMMEQDGFFTYVHLEAEKTLNYQKKISDNLIYTLLIDGEGEVKGELIQKRDAFGLSREEDFSFLSKKSTELLILEIPA